jgi:hypothetical protein
LFEPFQQLLYGAVLSRLSAGVQNVRQLTDGRGAGLPERLQDGQFRAGDVEIELR